MPVPAPLLIPHAASDMPECRRVLRDLQLPALSALLAQLSPGPVLPLGDDALDTPAERAWAEATGLPGADGRWPWAAQQAVRAGLAPQAHAWALLTPCHFEVGMNAVQLTDPAALRLTPDEAEALMASMAPYLAEDGIVCEAFVDGQWLAHGEPFRGLATASPERVLGEGDLNPWLPASPLLRRLQNEMQMLFYTHATNGAREAQGQPPINTLWISGCGTWPATAPAEAPAPKLVPSLRGSALQGDWSRWAQDWARVDAEHCAPLLASLRQGQSVVLTLCGRRSSQRWDTRPRSALSRLLAPWRKPQLAAVLEAL